MRFPPSPPNMDVGAPMYRRAVRRHRRFFPEIVVSLKASPVEIFFDRCIVQPDVPRRDTVGASGVEEARSFVPDDMVIGTGGGSCPDFAEMRGLVDQPRRQASGILLWWSS